LFYLNHNREKLVIEIVEEEKFAGEFSSSFTWNGGCHHIDVA
jgi:hypothetical protein